MLIAQVAIFSSTARFPLNFNILFSYVPMLALPIFANRHLPLPAILKLLFRISIGYCLVYALLGQSLAGMASDAGSVRVLTADGGRGARVVLAGAFCAFAYFYALTRLRATGGLIWIGLLAIAGAAAILSQGRTFILQIAIVTVMYLLGISAQARWLAVAAFLGVVLISVAGVIFPDLNPFTLFASDASGAARARGFSVIRGLVDEHFFFGVGIAPDTRSQSLFIGQPYLYWDDLGPLGVWYTFGFAGLLLFVWHVLVLIAGPPERVGLPGADRDGLALTGLLLGLGSLVSPGIWLGSGTMVIAIVFGLRVRSDTLVESDQLDAKQGPAVQ